MIDEGNIVLPGQVISAEAVSNVDPVIICMCVSYFFLRMNAYYIGISERSWHVHFERR